MDHEVFVVRHGETEWNCAGRLQGHKDSALTETGRAQARAMALWFAGQGVVQHRLLTSPLGRARATAAEIESATGLQAQEDARLMELGVGAWEGLTVEQIAIRGSVIGTDETYLDWCGRAPGGEGVAAMLARVQSVIRDLDGPTILVCHGLFSRLLRAEMLGVSPDDVEGGQGVIFRIRAGRSDRIIP